MTKKRFIKNEDFEKMIDLTERAKVNLDNYFMFTVAATESGEVLIPLNTRYVFPVDANDVQSANIEFIDDENLAVMG